MILPFATEALQSGHSKRRMPLRKNRNPCGTGGFDFYNMAIGGI
jgi:hypothetical protein